MPAAKLDLLIEQGATFRHTLFVKAGIGADAPAADLTGCKVRMQIRSDVDSPDVLIELTTENDRIATTPLDGRIDLRIDDEDTSALDFDAGVHDIEIEWSNGDVDRIVQGKVGLSREVTRD